MTDDKEENNKLKDFVLRDIYYNEKAGFQNQKRTYEAAKKRLSDITTNYVKQWLGRQKGNNSSHIEVSIFVSSMDPTKKLLLILLISAVILSTIGVMVVYLLLWMRLLSLHVQCL